MAAGGQPQRSAPRRAHQRPPAVCSRVLRSRLGSAMANSPLKGRALRQVGGDEHQGQPGGVDGEVMRMQIGQACIFGVADPAFHAAAVKRFQVGQVGIGRLVMKT
jgi:hypothetical protein